MVGVNTILASPARRQQIPTAFGTRALARARRRCGLPPRVFLSFLSLRPWLARGTGS